MTKSDLGRQVGVTPATAIRWELPPEHPDSRTPTVDKLALIAQITGVSFEWLATGRGEMAAPAGGGTTAPPVYSDDLLPLTADERQLLRRFRALPPKKRKAVIELLRE